MVYKLVAREDAAGAWIPVAKASAAKASRGGRKSAFRTLDRGVATSERIVVSGDSAPSTHPDTRGLQVELAIAGDVDTGALGPSGVVTAREHHARVRAELPVRALALSRGEPAIPTVFTDSQ
jgi:nicotinate phosphoribosyltransferase